jgi:hypothetical protein
VESVYSAVRTEFLYKTDKLNQCLLQNDSTYGSVFCFLHLSLDTHRFQIILNTVQPSQVWSSCFSSSIWFLQNYFLYGPNIRHSHQLRETHLMDTGRELMVAVNLRAVLCNSLSIFSNYIRVAIWLKFSVLNLKHSGIKRRVKQHFLCSYNILQRDVLYQNITVTV